MDIIFERFTEIHLVSIDKTDIKASKHSLDNLISDIQRNKKEMDFKDDKLLA